jgi:hypothetical protein
MELVVTSWAGVSVHANIANATHVPIFANQLRIPRNIDFSPFPNLFTNAVCVLNLKIP